MSANYKGAQLSNNPNNYANNSQRKFIRYHDGTLLNVYESLGYIWLEISFDGGQTWIIGNNGKPISEKDSKSPSIAQIGQSMAIIVYKQKKDDGYFIKALLYDIPRNSVFNVKVVRDVDFTTFEENSPPVIGCSRAAINDFIIIWREESSDDIFSPGGLYFSIGNLIVGSNGYPEINLYYNNGIFDNSDGNSFNPSVFVEVETYNYPVKFHIAWGQHFSGKSDIYYSRLNLDESKNIENVEFRILSNGSVFPENFKPSGIAVNDNAYVGWIGKRKYLPSTLTQESIYQTQAILTTTSNPEIFKIFGDEVMSVNLNRCNTRWTLAW